MLSKAKEFAAPPAAAAAAAAAWLWAGAPPAEGVAADWCGV